MRIWIQQLKLMRIHADPDPDTDPDPKPCLEFQVSEGLFVLSSMVRPKTLYSLGSNRGSGKKNIIYFKLVKRINYFVCRDEYILLGPVQVSRT
jgi:hypothetical protein